MLILRKIFLSITSSVWGEQLSYLWLFPNFGLRLVGRLFWIILFIYFWPRVLGFIILLHFSVYVVCDAFLIFLSMLYLEPWWCIRLLNYWCLFRMVRNSVTTCLITFPVKFGVVMIKQISCPTNVLWSIFKGYR